MRAVIGQYHVLAASNHVLDIGFWPSDARNDAKKPDPLGRSKQGLEEFTERQHLLLRTEGLGDSSDSSYLAEVGKFRFDGYRLRDDAVICCMTPEFLSLPVCDRDRIGPSGKYLLLRPICVRGTASPGLPRENDGEDVTISVGHSAISMTQNALESVTEAEEELKEVVTRAAAVEAIDSAKLQRSQDAWRTFAESDASLYAHLAEGGTLYPVLYAQRLQELIRYRVDGLEEFIEERHKA